MTDIQMIMDLEISDEMTISPESMTKRSHSHTHMQCLYDPSESIPRGYGYYQLHAFRESFEHWAEGSWWRGSGGDLPEQIYCKRGRFLVKSDHDSFQRARFASTKATTTKGSGRELLYT